MDGRMGAGDGIELRQGGSLMDRALAALAAGPRHTATLAEMVLGIRGSPPAAATAVFTLLGTDPRFTVDPSGVWSLVERSAPRAAACLLEEEWAVVDVETTGGAPEQGHRITEFAAVWVSGGRITDTYVTLVNPERRIPSMITSLTGISEGMVASAPTFRSVAPRIADALRGRVFVAHNAAFDWRFVGIEMERALGHRLEGRRLCTVRLAKKILPHLVSQNLDFLADYFGLEIVRRHRALDDAVATAQMLIRFCEILADRQIDDWEGMSRFLRRRAPRRKRLAMPRSMDSA